uniref:U1 small nuclear ribonucleoprotein C n=1 Tax=Globodera rostochiensis TaxID=31243 RepID=A0A914HA20_GLORO
MPKYYCDYCDAFLTHDSPSVRKTHNGGRKHKENVRMYYQAWMEEQAQKLIDATTRAFTSQRMLPAAAPGFMPPVSVPVPTMIPPRGPFVNPMAMVRPPMMPPSMAGFFTPPVLPPGMMTAAGNGTAIPLPVVTSAIMPASSTAAVSATNGGMPQQSPLRTAIKQQPQE